MIGLTDMKHSRYGSGGISPRQVGRSRFEKNKWGTILRICILLSGLATVRGDDLTTVSGQVFKNFRIVNSSQKGITITHSGGRAFVLSSDLPRGLVERKLQTRSGTIFEYCAVVRVSHNHFRIVHSYGSSWIRHDDAPEWLRKKYEEKITALQEEYVLLAVKKIIKSKKIEDGFAIYKKVVAEHPDHPGIKELKDFLFDFATKRVGKCGNAEEGIAICETVIRELPDHPGIDRIKKQKEVFAEHLRAAEEIRRAVRQAKAEKDHDRAVGILEKVIAAHPEHGDIRMAKDELNIVKAPAALEEAKQGETLAEIIRRLEALIATTPRTRSHEQAEALLKRCVDAEKAGRSPLHMAVQGDPGWVKYLLDHGADVNARDENGATPLLFAKEPGKHEIMDLLLAKGADVNAAGHWSRTPLHVMCTQVDPVGVEKLLAAGADVNRKDRDGATPLCAAIMPLGGQRDNPRAVEIVRQLLSKGADPKIGRNPFGYVGMTSGPLRCSLGALLLGIEIPKTTEFIDFDGRKITISWTLTPQQAQSQGFHHEKLFDARKSKKYSYYSTGFFSLIFDRESHVLLYCVLRDPCENENRVKKRNIAALEANARAHQSRILIPTLLESTKVSAFTHAAVIRPYSELLIFSFGFAGTHLTSVIRVYNPAFFPADEGFIKINYKDF